MYHHKIESDGLTYAPPGQMPLGGARREDEIVRRYTPLVQKIAWHVHGGNSAIEIEDMIQIGLIALIEAWRVFEERGAVFSTYATTRVRGAMIDHLRKVATISRRGMANRKQIEAARRRVQMGLGRAATHDEIAAFMGLSIEDYYARLESAQTLMIDSLEDQYSDNNLFFADLSESASSELEREETLGQLEGCIADLNQREATILQLYFIEQRNLAEIAEIMGVGSARICQIKKRALEKLRGGMERLHAA